METEKRRLIAADSLIDGMKKRCNFLLEEYDGYDHYADGYAEAINYVENAPTVDAVPVVRCKDCKHRGEEGCCPMYFVDEIEWDDDGYIEVDYVPHDYTVDDGFCDRGERRTNNG